MQWITAIIGLLVGLSIIYFIRRDRLLVRHGVGWICVAAALITIGLFPGLVDRAAQWAGVAYPPTLAMILGFAALILKALISDIEISRSEVRITRLVQRIAMLEADIRNLSQHDPERSLKSPDTDR
tara:strand:+ start:117 stop:494 length:378 start_codon:yes stop_codon:yes gene_type:complete